MSDYIMVSSPTMQSDLVTKTDYVVYIPLATEETYGTVKIGKGLNIDNGVISFDTDEITIKSISKNGELLIPDENKHIDFLISVYDVGLENVDNTSDLDKPISTLQQKEFDKKLDKKQDVLFRGKYLYINDNGDIDFSDPSLYINSYDWIGVPEQKITNITFGNDFNVSVPENKQTILNLAQSVHKKIEDSLKTVEYDITTGVLNFTKTNGEHVSIDLPLELLVKSGYYDEFTQSLILVLANDDVISIPVDALVKDVYSKEEINELLESKQNILTAGRGIQITEENVINVLIDDTISDISTNPVQNRVLYQVFEAQEERFSRLLDEFNYKKQDKLTAGENITIDENNVISATGGGELKIEDLPKFINKIYVNMANASSLAGVLTLPVVSSSNFVVNWGDDTTTEYTGATSIITHTYSNARFAGWIYIYGDWKGINIGSSPTDDNNDAIYRVVYDKNITSLPSYAFNGCFYLHSIELPDTITTIPARAFNGCYQLTNINLPNTITSMGEYAFYNCRAIRELYLPSSITSVGSYCFGSCKGIIKVRLSNRLSNIPNYCFYGASAVDSVIIPDSVTTIYLNGFAGCSALKKVEIGTGISNIQQSAFATASQLKEIIIRRTTPPTLASSGPFPDTVSIINVPSGSLKSYKKASNWTELANKIYPIGGNYAETITIPASSWDNATNTVTVEAVGATSEARNVITWFTSSDGSQVENTYGLKCTAQGTMSLTFSCETIPIEDVEVSVSYMLTNY